jgi:hypothetical protein
MPFASYGLEQLKLDSYQVLVINPHANVQAGGPDKKVVATQDVTSICTSIQWDYDLDQAFEKFTLTFVRVADLSVILKALNHIVIRAIRTDAVFGVGTKLEDLKWGVIVEGSLTATARGEMQITAYDIMWYLASNKSSHQLMGETASQFITRIAAKYGIPLGYVEDTKITIGPEPFLERTLYDMFVTVLSTTRDIAYAQRIQEHGEDILAVDPVPPQLLGDRYYMRVKFDRINVVKKQDPSRAWKFQTGNLMEASAKWTAANYRNIVRVYQRYSTDYTGVAVTTAITMSEDGDISWNAQWPKNPDADPDVQKYGMLTESVSLVGASDPNLMQLTNIMQAEYQAKELLVRLKRIAQTATISTININTLGPGDLVILEEPISGLVGKYYVKAGQHRVTAQSSIMNLTLNLDDLLPEAYKTKRLPTTPLLGGGPV